MFNNVKKMSSNALICCFCISKFQLVSIYYPLFQEWNSDVLLNNNQATSSNKSNNLPSPSTSTLPKEPIEGNIPAHSNIELKAQAALEARTEGVIGKVELERRHPRFVSSMYSVRPKGVRKMTWRMSNSFDNRHLISKSWQKLIRQNTHLFISQLDSQGTGGDVVEKDTRVRGDIGHKRSYREIMKGQDVMKSSSLKHSFQPDTLHASRKCLSSTIPPSDTFSLSSYKETSPEGEAPSLFKHSPMRAPPRPHHASLSNKATKKVSIDLSHKIASSHDVRNHFPSLHPSFHSSLHPSLHPSIHPSPHSSLKPLALLSKQQPSSMPEEVAMDPSQVEGFTLEGHTKQDDIKPISHELNTNSNILHDNINNTTCSNKTTIEDGGKEEEEEEEDEGAKESTTLLGEGRFFKDAMCQTNSFKHQ